MVDESGDVPKKRRAITCSLSRPSHSGTYKKVLISMNSTNEKVIQSTKGAKSIQNETEKMQYRSYIVMGQMPNPKFSDYIT